MEPFLLFLQTGTELVWPSLLSLAKHTAIRLPTSALFLIKEMSSVIGSGLQLIRRAPQHYKYCLSGMCPGNRPQP